MDLDWFPFAFGFPWALLALAPIALLPRRRGWPLRYAALALLVVALAQPRTERPGDRVAVLVDASASVGGGAVAAAREFDFASLSPEPQRYLFAADAVGVDGFGAPPPSALDTGETDLARALQVAAAGGADRILLIGDGGASRGDPLAAAPGVPVDALHVASRDNARLTALLAPETAAPGETVEVVAVVESDVATEIELRPEVGGDALEPIVRSIEPGRSALAFTFTVEGDEAVPVRADLLVGFDQPTRDDGLATDVAVAEEEPVLVLSDPALADLLRVQGFDVVEGSEADVRIPFDYSAVVVREGAGRFTPGQLELLRDYVEGGGGLLMTGGPDSFGFGSWYRTPVEAVLPVDTDLRTDVALPLVALVIVLDRSQSMSTGNPSKIDLAKEGAIGVVELAYQDDLLGMIAFSDRDRADWVFELRPATDRGKLEMLQRILALGTQGGTVLEPAYRMALDTLERTDAAVKHIIILSDGKLYDGQGAFSQGAPVDFGALASGGLGSRITTSTIAIGESADFARLETIAEAGGGRYYEALDVGTLPRIFTNEALTATRSLLRDERFTPGARSHPLMPEGADPPPVDSYIASTLKPDAELLIEAREGEPLLAVRRQGLGRSAALTTDLNGAAGTAGAFGRWDRLPALLGTVTRWLQADPAEVGVEVRRDGTALEVTVDAVEDGEYLNNRPFALRWRGGELPLEQVGPGRYRGRVEAESGEGVLLVTEGDEVVARERVSSPAPEFDTRGGNELLATLARTTGGELLSEPGRYAPTGAAVARAWWPPLVIAAFALLLLELAWRRFGPAVAGTAGPQGRAS